MIYELIFSSVPRGLRAGRSGFATAAATAEMSPAVMIALERLSGYAFHYNLSDANASKNPPNYSHLRAPIGRSTSSVLSRVAFAGADYSGRANKIAHHFLLSQRERVSQGPAWMLLRMRRQAFVDGYSGPPRHLAPRSLADLTGREVQPAAAPGWADVAGDAGWAGALVRAWRTAPRVPAFVIYEPGRDILPLLAESLALLAPEDRWRVGFATYFSASLPVGTECHWRGILAGSAQVGELARYPGATVLDLTAPLGAPPDDAYTEAARAGRALTPRKRSGTMVNVADALAEPADVDPHLQPDGVGAAVQPDGSCAVAERDQADPGDDDPLAGLAVSGERASSDGSPAGPARPRRRKLDLLIVTMLLLALNLLTFWMYLTTKAAAQRAGLRITELETENHKLSELVKNLQRSVPPAPKGLGRPNMASVDDPPKPRTPRDVAPKPAPRDVPPVAAPRPASRPAPPVVARQPAPDVTLGLVEEDAWRKYKPVTPTGTVDAATGEVRFQVSKGITAWARPPKALKGMRIAGKLASDGRVATFEGINGFGAFGPLLRGRYDPASGVLTVRPLAGGAAAGRLAGLTVGLCEPGGDGGTLYLCTIPPGYPDARKAAELPVVRSAVFGFDERTGARLKLAPLQPPAVLAHISVPKRVQVAFHSKPSGSFKKARFLLLLRAEPAGWVLNTAIPETIRVKARLVARSRIEKLSKTLAAHQETREGLQTPKGRPGHLTPERAGRRIMETEGWTKRKLIERLRDAVADARAARGKAEAIRRLLALLVREQGDELKRLRTLDSDLKALVAFIQRQVVANPLVLRDAWGRALLKVNARFACPADLAVITRKRPGGA